MMGYWGMIKKGADEYIKKIPNSPRQYKKTKICTLRNCSFT